MFDERNPAEYGLALSATLVGVTPAKGKWIDMRGFRACTFSVSTGVVTDAGTAAGFSFEIQESDLITDASATAVADADLVGTEAALTVTSDAADHTFVGSIGYVGSKRYVRVVCTGTALSDAAVSVHATKRRGNVQGTATIDSGITAT